jgi:hypothetical protein
MTIYFTVYWYFGETNFPHVQSLLLCLLYVCLFVRQTLKMQPDYMASHLRRLYSSQLPTREPQIMRRSKLSYLILTHISTMTHVKLKEFILSKTGVFTGRLVPNPLIKRPTKITMYLDIRTAGHLQDDKRHFAANTAKTTCVSWNKAPHIRNIGTGMR